MGKSGRRNVRQGRFLRRLSLEGGVLAITPVTPTAHSRFAIEAIQRLSISFYLALALLRRTLLFLLSRTLSLALLRAAEISKSSSLARCPTASSVNRASCLLPLPREPDNLRKLAGAIKLRNPKAKLIRTDPGSQPPLPFLTRPPDEENRIPQNIRQRIDPDA